MAKQSRKTLDTEHLTEAVCYTHPRQASTRQGKRSSARTRRSATLLIGLLLLFVCIGLGLLNSASGTGWEIRVDGQSLAYLVSEEEAQQALQLCLDNTAAQFLNAESAESVGLHYRNEVQIRHASPQNSDYCSAEEAAQILQDYLQLEVEAMALLIDGEPQIYVADADAAISAIAQAKARFGLVGEDGVSAVYTSEEISMQKQSVSFDQVCSAEEAAQLLTQDSAPLITVRVERETQEKQAIPYQTTRVSSDELELGQEQLITAGQDGEQLLTYRTIEVNGQQVASEEVGSVVLKEAVDEVIEVGHAVVISSRSGSTLAAFIWPLEDEVGIITSRFGWRSRGWHSGIDVAHDYDTTIVASESGTVSYAAYNGSGYGNLVIIDHGNGIETYYAHCNNFYVQEGDEVERGDAIASIGMTGTTTGPHVHFEIRIDGTTIDPLSYLEY